MEHRALGAFLRGCREAVRPGDVGLPQGPGRRTPGLRRAELAALAGVSVEYLTRLERGRGHRPSPEVIGALAGALRLTDDEHVHLLRLVKVSSGDDRCPAADRTVRPSVLQLLQRLDAEPALVIDRCGEVLARSAGTDRLGLPVTTNIARFVVTDPRAGHLLDDRDALADEWAARLRTAAELGDARATALAAELGAAAGSDFAARYGDSVRIPAWSGTERWAGRSWHYEAPELPGTPEHRLLVYLSDSSHHGRTAQSGETGPCPAPSG